MYELVTMRMKVRLDPRHITDKNKMPVLKEEINKMLSGKIIDNRMIGISCIEIKEVGEGEVLIGDGGAYYDVTFDMLAFQPILKEVYRGQVVDITEIGAMVNIGPIDGFAHISQVMDDFAEYQNGTFVGRNSKQTLKVGDTVLAAITSISVKDEMKIGLTMRSPGLGKIEGKAKKEKK